MTYRSIVFERDWIMRRYSGWKLECDQPEYKVLIKGMLFRKVCILSEISAEALAQRLNVGRFMSRGRAVILKFFTHGEETDSLLRWTNLRLTSDAQRMFHKFTFVINLDESIEILWKGMRATNRNLCKRAQGGALKVRIEKRPSGTDLDIFLGMYTSMAASRSLTIPSGDLLRRMSLDGHLTAAVVEQGNSTLAMALIYTAGESAVYLYGASATRLVEGCGQLLQWSIIEYLKRRGFRWYDLGGVPEAEESNGIFKFKKGFGGVFVRFGSEFNWTPAWFVFLRRLRQCWR